jgi:hypothetical protein
MPELIPINPSAAPTKPESIIEDLGEVSAEGDVGGKKGKFHFNIFSITACIIIIIGVITVCAYFLLKWGVLEQIEDMEKAAKASRTAVHSQMRR